MKASFGNTLSIAVSLLLMSAVHLSATPGPGIVMSDEIIGATAKSYFVIRTTRLRPPTYYQFLERIEFVELSIPDGKVRKRCLLRETDNQSDVGADKETWKRTERKASSCRPFDVLSHRNARYIEPQSRDGSAYSFRLGTDGLAVKSISSEATINWTGVASLKETKQRTVTVATIPTAMIPWQTHSSPNTDYDLLWLETGDQPLHEACKIDPVAMTAIDIHWVFLRFFCWSGDDDADGANFFIPVDSRLWLKSEN